MLIEGYDDYWVFVSETNPKERFLISQKLSVLANKNLSGGGYFTLSYVENEVVKKIVRVGSGDNKLILLESNFVLTPDSPLQDDPNFLANWGNDEVKEKVQFLMKDNGEGKETLVFNNYFADKNGQMPDTLKVFHITTDTILARQLIRENKLQERKKFILSFTEVAQHDESLNFWYFDTSCDRKIWISEV